MIGLLGEHLRHSYSPRLHALLGNERYTLFEIPPEGLDAFLRSDRFDALNVTIPYKQAVLPYCKTLSDAARRIGSVNTLLRLPDGSLYGDNTDYDGFLWMLRRCGGLRRGERALVLGSGGASRTVQTALRELGAEVTVLSRRGETRYGDLSRYADAALVVNATPVGMYPGNGERLIDLDALPRCRLVLDLIYNPARTRLLLDAEERGIRHENGLPMLVAQAGKAERLFTGLPLPEERYEAALQQLAAEMRNLILIGMPGCGKTAVGKALAARLGRPFLDADAELARKLGCGIPAFFARAGEAAFRRAETEVLAELGKRSGCVIATGGGCVTREENYPLLHQNGVIFLLRRALRALPTQGRPLSREQGVEALYAARAPLYAEFADRCVDNSGSVDDCVRAILEEL